MTTRENGFTSADLRNLLNTVILKIDSYEKKINNIEEKVSELSVIKHQIEYFSTQFSEIQTDIRSLRTEYETLKSNGHKIEEIVKWKNQIEQILTVSDMSLLKNKSYNLELLVAQLTERLSTIKEDIKRETFTKSLGAGAGAGTIIAALAQAIAYLVKNN